jgi:hypothetical protein
MQHGYPARPAVARPGLGGAAAGDYAWLRKVAPVIEASTEQTEPPRLQPGGRAAQCRPAPATPTCSPRRASTLMVGWLARVVVGSAGLRQVLVDNPTRLYGFAR